MAQPEKAKLTAAIATDKQSMEGIQEKLDKLGFLARLQEYEPVDFWSSKA